MLKVPFENDFSPRCLPLPLHPTPIAAPVSARSAFFRRSGSEQLRPTRTERLMPSWLALGYGETSWISGRSRGLVTPNQLPCSSRNFLRQPWSSRFCILSSLWFFCCGARSLSIFLLTCSVTSFLEMNIVFDH